MLQHPDVLAIIEARDKYRKLSNAFVTKILTTYKSKAPSKEGFGLFLDTVVADKELIQEILSHLPNF